jgi:hypothetical protein
MSSDPTTTQAIPQRSRNAFGRLPWDLLLVLFVSTALRFHQLGDIPALLSHDEADNTRNALSILEGLGPSWREFDWKPQPALAVNVIALSIATIGDGVFAVRLPAVVYSLITVALVWYLTRPFGRVAAVSSSLLCSTHPAFLHFSRFGWENAGVAFASVAALGVVLMVLVAQDERRRMLGAAVVGVLAAFGFMIYFGGRTIIVSILCSFAACGNSISFRLRGTQFAIAAGTFSLPFLAIRDVPRSLFMDSRTSAVVGGSVLGGMEKAVRNVNDALMWLLTPRHADPRYFPPDEALISPVLLGLVLLGVAVLIRQRRWTYLFTGLLFFSFPYFASQAVSPGRNFARALAAFPILFLFMAPAIEALAIRAHRYFRLAIVCLVATLCMQQTRVYFAWVQSPELLRVLAPAVSLADVPCWWNAQVRMLRRKPFDSDFWPYRAPEERGPNKECREAIEDRP